MAPFGIVLCHNTHPKFSACPGPELQGGAQHLDCSTATGSPPCWPHPRSPCCFVSKPTPPCTGAATPYPSQTPPTPCGPNAFIPWGCCSLFPFQPHFLNPIKPQTTPSLPGRRRRACRGAAWAGRGAAAVGAAGCRRRPAACRGEPGTRNLQQKQGNQHHVGAQILLPRS